MKFRLEHKRKKKQPGKLALALAPWRLQLVVGLLLAVVIGLLGSAVWYGSRIDALQLTTVTVVGGTTVKATTIESAVSSVLSGTYFRLVPHRFAPLYPHDAIVRTVGDIPRVHHVQVERTDWQTLTVVFDEYQPAALACAEDRTNECYFIDRNGFAFTKAPDLTGGAMVRYVNQDNEPVLKQEAFDAVYMDITSAFIADLEEQLGLFVVKVIRRDDVDTSYILSTGAELKTSNRLTVGETFTNLQSILTSDEFSGVADGSFHYIDLRFGDKVFVSETATPATSTSTDETIDAE